MRWKRKESEEDMADDDGSQTKVLMEADLGECVPQRGSGGVWDYLLKLLDLQRCFSAEMLACSFMFSLTPAFISHTEENSCFHSLYLSTFLQILELIK